MDTARARSGMQFSSTVAAIQWAEDIASRSDIKSQFKSIIDGHGGRGGDTVWDIAMSISARVASCEPKRCGLALKAIYAGHDRVRDIHLGQQIGDHIYAKQVHKNQMKDLVQCQNLGLATVKAERAMTLYSDKYPLARMANDIGIGRKNFTTGIGWISLRYEAREALQDWLKMGENEVAIYLNDLGWLWD